LKLSDPDFFAKHIAPAVQKLERETLNQVLAQ